MDYPITFEAPQLVEISVHAGGGAEVLITAQDGTEHTFDIVPALDSTSERAQRILSLIGQHLSVSIGQSVRQPERAPADLSDVTDAPHNLILPIRILEQS